MPTKRVKRTPAQVGLSPEAIEAWRIGDFHALNRALGFFPYEISPFDADEVPPTDGHNPWYTATWPRAAEMRKRLIEVAGPPGGVGRHGDPLGPGVPSYRDGDDEDEQEEDDHDD